MSTVSPSPVPVVPIPLKRTKRSRRRLIVVVIVVALLAVSGLVVYVSLQPQTSAPPNSIPVENGLVTVYQGVISDYQFIVPATAKSPVFNGTFRVKGGSNNVIEIYVMNSTVFVQWQKDMKSGINTGSLPYIYSSGEVNSGKTMAVLTPGVTYYLAFNDVQHWNEVVLVSSYVLGV